VRQRNAQPYPLIVGDDPPYLAAPGQEVNHPDLLAGFEPVDTDPTPVSAPPVTPRKTGRSAAASDEEATS
jgi:hypothetical protein